MNSYINTLREMLDKYESKPEVYNKLIALEAKIISGECNYGSNKK